MLDWLLDDDFGQWVLIVAAFCGLVAAERFARANEKRFLAWLAGMLGIGLLIWLKGADEAWTWLLALGWLGVLVYVDRRFLTSGS